jgi:hypothetical protein
MRRARAFLIEATEHVTGEIDGDQLRRWERRQM